MGGGGTLYWVVLEIRLRCGLCWAGFHAESKEVDLQVQCYICHKQMSTFLWKILHLEAYKLQGVQTLTARVKQLRSQFAVHMYIQILEHDNLRCIVFSEKAKFHISGCFSRHNCVIWGSG